MPPENAKSDYYFASAKLGHAMPSLYIYDDIYRRKFDVEP